MEIDVLTFQCELMYGNLKEHCKSTFIIILLYKNIIIIICLSQECIWPKQINLQNYGNYKHAGKKGQGHFQYHMNLT